MAKKNWVRGEQILVILVVSCLTGGLVLALRVDAAQQLPTGGRFLMAWRLIRDLGPSDPASASLFFNTPEAFAKDATVPGFAATPIVPYDSYAQFASDLSTGSFPSGFKWVQYDPENWTATPTDEQQHPDVYLKNFADLAHQHGLLVYEVPARDLMAVPGSDCSQQTGESVDQAFIRCQLPADSRYADIFSLQSQADQLNTSEFTSFVQSAVTQIRSVAPNITVFAGLTTLRTGDSADNIFACWEATHMMVDGYWLNASSATLPVAASALDMIRVQSSSTGDLNGDGKVNLLDLSIMLSEWGSANATADLNHDGIVNVDDLSILLGNWTG